MFAVAGDFFDTNWAICKIVVDTKFLKRKLRTHAGRAENWLSASIILCSVDVAATGAV